jgi:hypothetical protein
MGHLRLSTLPDTIRWRQVVAHLAEGSDAATVAAATIQAALRGLDLAHNDPGLVHTVWLLLQFAQAARSADFPGELHRAGLAVGNEPGVFDLVAAFSDAVDRRLDRGRTDLGEMAQLSATECLTGLLSRSSASLFGTTSADVRQAAYELSTQAGFARLFHSFFSRFAQRFLTYHLGRELSNHVGGNGRFATTFQHDAFVDDLKLHCDQVALIVRDFAGEWYSKHRFLQDITPEKSRRFANYALFKLRSELEVRGARHG